MLPPTGRDISFSTQNMAMQGRKPAPCDHFRSVLREYNLILESRLMPRRIFLSALKKSLTGATQAGRTRFNGDGAYRDSRPLVGRCRRHGGPVSPQAESVRPRPAPRAAG